MRPSRYAGNHQSGIAYARASMESSQRAFVDSAFLPHGR